MLWFLVLGIAPVLLISLIGHAEMTRFALRDADAKLVAESGRAAAVIDSRIRDRIRAISTLSSRTEVIRQLKSKRTALPDAAISAELNQFLRDNPDLFDFVAVADVAGVILGSAGNQDVLGGMPLPPTPGRSRPATELRYIKELDVLEIVAPIGSVASGFARRYTIPETSSSATGLIRARTRVAALASVMEETELGRTGFLALLSSRGEVISGPAGLASALTRSPHLYGRLYSSYPVSFEAQGLVSRAPAVMAVTPLPSTAGPSTASLGGAKWLVLAEQSKAEILSVPHSFGRIAVVVVLLTTAVVLLVAMYLSERIVLPLRRLRDGARKIASGQLDLELNLPTGDEIEDLSSEFTAMARQLTESYRGLEEKVRQATRELDQRNKSLEAILAAMNEGLMVLDPNAQILLWNSAAEKMTGFSIAEAVGRSCAELLRPATADAPTICDIACRAQTREAGVCRTTVYTSDGRTLPIAVSAAPLRNDSGENAGCVVVMRNLTKEIELDRFKSDMVSIVSHELRTPLAPLIGFAEMLQDPNLPPDKREHYLNMIIEQGRRLSALVENFLTLSQLEAGRFELHLEDADLRRLADEVLAVESARSPMHKLVNAIPADLPHVRVDRDRIRRVIHNLVSNALKYSPRGGTVTVAARQVGEEVEISVTDQGVGIRREDLPRLFERFQRMHREDLPDVRGTGLGLSICKNIVEEHGGSIRAESRYGKGSTFLIRIPRQGPQNA